MIEPTVGRVVWYRPDSYDRAKMAVKDNDPLVGHVVAVWSSNMVSLAVFDANGELHQRTSIVLRQPEDEAPDGAFCEWMPYQKGQAAKTEELERQVRR